MCYLKNFRGSCSPLLKAQGCSLPAPHHSGHGNENSKKIRITLVNALRPGLGMPAGGSSH